MRVRENLHTHKRDDNHRALRDKDCRCCIRPARIDAKRVRSLTKQGQHICIAQMKAKHRRTQDKHRFIA